MNGGRPVDAYLAFNHRWFGFHPVPPGLLQGSLRHSASLLQPSPGTRPGAAVAAQLAPGSVVGTAWCIHSSGDVRLHELKATNMHLHESQPTFPPSRCRNEPGNALLAQLGRERPVPERPCVNWHRSEVQHQMCQDHHSQQVQCQINRCSSRCICSRLRP